MRVLLAPEALRRPDEPVADRRPQLRCSPARWTGTWSVSAGPWLVAEAPTSGLYDLGPALRRLGAEALRRVD